MTREGRSKRPRRKGPSAAAIVTAAVFIVGLALLLYPTVSNYINSINASHAIESYDNAVGELSEAERQQMLEAAEAYNRSILEEPVPFVSGPPKDDTYRSLLNVGNAGMMGYVSIQKIDVELPIYHGTDDGALASGAGHLEGSSLPVGGVGNHAVITGHRGLPSARLFTDLDQLEKGDTFTVSVLGRTLTYQVDQIKIVQPYEIDDLAIDPDQDYCTLLTCTPYAVNTERLLVRGTRVEGASRPYVLADAKRIDPLTIAPFVAAPILIILLIALLRGGSKKPRGAAAVERIRSERLSDKRRK